MEQTNDLLGAKRGAPSPFNLDDFDDDFDDDFEAEVVGEYEIEDDEYARQLLDIVDFEIEGLSFPSETESPADSGVLSDDSDPPS